MQAGRPPTHPDLSHGRAGPHSDRFNGAFYARSIPMMDVVMVAIAFVFFAVSIAYVYACERL